MSLDLYNIGANLISEGRTNVSLDGVVGKVALLQEAMDRVSSEFSLANAAIADLFDTTADITTFWSLTAEAAARMAETSSAKPGIAPVSGNNLVPAAADAMAGANGGEYFNRSNLVADGTARGGNNGGFEMPYDWTDNIQFQMPQSERQGVAAENADFLNAVGLSQLPQLELGGISQGGGAADMADRYAQTWNSALGFQLAEPTQTVRSYDDGDSVQSSGLGADGYGPSTEWPGAEDDGDGRELQRFNNPDAENGFARLLAIGTSGSAFGTMASDQMLVTNDLSGPDDANDADVLEQELFSRIKAASENASAQHITDSSDVRNADYSENAFHSGVRAAAAAMFQNGRLRHEFAGVGAIPDASGVFPTFIGGDNAQNTYDRSIVTNSPAGLDLVQTTELRAGETPSDFDFSSLNGFDTKAAGGTNAVAAIGQTAGLFSGQAMADASGPPGWLVALTSAVVMELRGSGFQNYTGTAEGMSGSRQSPPGPIGTRNDPLHVKMVDRLAPYQTHMPTGSTASLPSQSPPVPGQVQFSP